jgi:regulator of sigma E protease
VRFRIRRLRIFAAAGEQGWEGDALERLGVRFYRPDMPPVIGKVVAGGPGAKAGLQVGDRVLAVDGEPVATWMDFVAKVREAAGRSLRLEVDAAA